MRVYGRSVNQTPVFFVPSTSPEPWKRAWGATAQADGWLLPAYWPFGAWAFKDLSTFVRVGLATIEWDATAIPYLQGLQAAEAAWAAAEAAYASGGRVALPVEDDFFPPDYVPFAHQRLGIARALLAPRVFFLWEMGTGKTKTIVDTLRVLRREHRFRRALVVAPTVVLPTWEREVARCSQGTLTSQVWTEGPGEADFVLATYARVRLDAGRLALHRQLLKQGGVVPDEGPHLEELDYDVLVVDESHGLGNWDSEQTRAVLALSTTGKAHRRYLLSGTAADHPLKLYPQLRCLSPGLVPASYQAYEEKHLVRNPQKRYLVQRYKGLNALNAVVDSVALRMKKADCLDLPPLTVTDVVFELGPAQQARYNELIVEMKASVEPDLQYVHLDPDAEDAPLRIGPALFGLAHGAARVNKLLQVVSGFLIVGPDVAICDACPNMPTCVAQDVRPYTTACAVVKVRPPTKVVRDVENPKLEAFEDLLTNILEADATNKVLCWGSYLPELDDLEALLRRKQVGYVRVDGSSSHRVREFEEAFAQDPATRVWLSQVSAGIGINLVAANYAIYYALPWDLAKYLQSMERNNRPGQTRPMTAYRLLGRGTLDTYVAKVLEHKAHIAFTLVEKVACAACDDQGRCGPKGYRPFKEGCKYQPDIHRPIAKVEVIR